MNMRFVLPIFALVAVIGIPRPAHAAHATGTGTLTWGPATLTSSYQDGENRVLVQDESLNFTGVLSGPFMGTVTTVININTDSQNSDAVGTCICRLDDRVGLVTLDVHTADGRPGSFRILKAKGALRGLRGRAGFKGQGTDAQDYSLLYIPSW